MDRAVSEDSAVQRQLDRLAALSPGADILGLERISALLARLGNPERRLPPVYTSPAPTARGFALRSTHAFLRLPIRTLDAGDRASYTARTSSASTSASGWPGS